MINDFPKLHRTFVAEPSHEDILARKSGRVMCRPSNLSLVVYIRPLGVMALILAFLCHEIHEIPCLIESLEFEHSFQPLCIIRQLPLAVWVDEIAGILEYHRFIAASGEYWLPCRI